MFGEHHVKNKEGKLLRPPRKTSRLNQSLRNQWTVYIISKGGRSAAFAVSASISNSIISVHFGWKRLLPVRDHVQLSGSHAVIVSCEEIR
jgi:hypothetical protein